MSRRRIVDGVDERGRPVARWADPEPADEPKYGHMEPAFAAPIERRVLSEAEWLALTVPSPRRASPTQRAWNGMDPKRPALVSADHVQESRQNGARRHQEVMAARRAPSPEEPAVSEPRADHAETIPGVDVGLDHLAVASEAARVAWDARAVACEAWDIARTALAEAWRAVSDEVLEAPGPFMVVERHVSAASNVELAAPKLSAALVATKRQPGRHPSKAQEATEKAERAARVMAAMERHGDDQRAVAVELGMRANAVAMVVKHARARAEAGA